MADMFVADWFSLASTRHPSIIHPVADRPRLVIMNSPCLEYNSFPTDSIGLVCFRIVKPLPLRELLTYYSRPLMDSTYQRSITGSAEDVLPSHT